MGQSMGVWSFHGPLGLPPSLQLYVFIYQEANLIVQEFLYSLISSLALQRGWRLSCMRSVVGP